MTSMRHLLTLMEDAQGTIALSVKDIRAALATPRPKIVGHTDQGNIILLSLSLTPGYKFRITTFSRKMKVIGHTDYTMADLQEAIWHWDFLIHHF